MIALLALCSACAIAGPDLSSESERCYSMVSRPDRPNRPESENPDLLCLFDAGRATLDTRVVQMDLGAGHARRAADCFSSGRIEEPMDASTAADFRVTLDPGICSDGSQLPGTAMICHRQEPSGVPSSIECSIGQHPIVFSTTPVERKHNWDADQALAAYEGERFGSALRYLTKSLREDPTNPSGRDLAILVATLISLDRQVEAAAMARFVGRFMAGEIDESNDPGFDLRDCTHLRIDQAPSSRMILAWGKLPSREDDNLGRVVVRAAIDADASFAELDVVSARHPASALMIIEMVAGSRLSRAAVARQGKHEFPATACMFWNRDSIPWHGIIRNNMRGTVR